MAREYYFSATGDDMVGMPARLEGKLNAGRDVTPDEAVRMIVRNAWTKDFIRVTPKNVEVHGI